METLLIYTGMIDVVAVVGLSKEPSKIPASSCRQDQEVENDACTVLVLYVVDLSLINTLARVVERELGMEDRTSTINETRGITTKRSSKGKLAFKA